MLHLAPDAQTLVGRIAQVDYGTTENISEELISAELTKHLVALDQPVRPIEIHHSFRPGCQSVAGTKVGTHEDGIDCWQPMLILQNSGWTIRGSSQWGLDPQPPGTLLILDIKVKHQVSGRSKEPWVSINWNPGHTPVPKSKYTLEEVIIQAKFEFKKLLEAEISND